MRPGPAPKPREMREMGGRVHQRRSGRVARVARPLRVPYAPRHLCAEGQREWRRMARWLMDAGLYTNVDHAGLEMYCQAYGLWVEAERTLEEEGQLLKSEKGNQVWNLTFTLAAKRWDQLRKMLGEFGLTPAQRSRIVAGQDPEKSLAELLFQGPDEG
jgi:P27 family predicted phage terminase small subunit